MKPTIDNLPPQPTSFVGRATELREIGDLLADPDCRLLTLVGPGGIGKTRLALEAAARLRDAYADGVCFVPLQPLASPEDIVPTIIRATGLAMRQADDLKAQLLEQLRACHLLLVVDNCEHLLEGLDVLADILGAAPGVKVLATSREVLNLREEWVYTVQGMRHPGMNGADGSDGRQLEDYSAVRLFVQSARRVRPDFSLEEERDGVGRICALVEGMPLALELAATWVRMLSCAEIAAEIARNLDILKTRARNVPSRHSSMRAVLDHSWALLTPDEQGVFKRLSCFRGGFTREAARVVAGASLPILLALVDKSLLRHHPDGRYDLHELVRQYAERQLNRSPEDGTDLRDRHCAYYMSFLAQQWPLLVGSRPGEALQNIERDIQNVHFAWRWAAALGLVEEIGRGLDSLWFFYDTRGWYREGEQAFALVSEILDVDPTSAEQRLIRGRVLARQGVLCNSLNRFENAEALLQEGLRIFRELDAQADIGFALLRLGEVAGFQGQLAEATAYVAASRDVCRAVGDRWNEAYALHWLGALAPDRETALAYHRESAAIFRELDSQWGIAVATPMGAFVPLGNGRFEEAMRLAQEGLALCQEIGIQWGSAMSLEVMGHAAYGLQRYAEAQRYYVDELRIALDSYLQQYIARAAFGIGLCLVAQGQQARAVEFLAIAHRYLTDMDVQDYFVDFDDRVPPDLLEQVRARSRTMDGQVEAARALLAEGLPAQPETDALPVEGVPEVPAAPAPAVDMLSERELEIVRLVAAGMSNREIAGALFLAPGTVKWYLNQVYSKLGVGSRTQAVARAREMGLLS